MPDGSLDANFNVQTNLFSQVLEIVLQTDGRVLLGGTFTRVGGLSKVSVARLLTNNLRWQNTVRFRRRQARRYYRVSSFGFGVLPIVRH
jgi:hypothetical protein